MVCNVGAGVHVRMTPENTRNHPIGGDDLNDAAQLRLTPELCRRRRRRLSEAKTRISSGSLR